MDPIEYAFATGTMPSITDDELRDLNNLPASALNIRQLADLNLRRLLAYRRAIQAGFYTDQLGPVFAQH